MAIVKAKYFRTKVGDPNNPTEVPFLSVPQSRGHSEKDIQVSEETVKNMKIGDFMDVDTEDLPYLRTFGKGNPVGKMSDSDKDDIANKVTALLRNKKD